MALARRTTVNRIEISDDGQIGIRLRLEIVEDAEVLVSRYHRFVLEPGESVIDRFAAINASLLADHRAPPVGNGVINRVDQISALVWTPAIITAWLAIKAAAQAGEN